MNGIDTSVNFNFSFGEDVTRDQRLGFEIAGDLWSQHLADSYQGQDLEINIYVEASDEILPENIVGGSFPTIETGWGNRYSEIYDAIQNDITTDLDQTVADNLLDRRSIDMLVGEEIIDYNFKTQVTRANMKALGMVAGDSAELDGYILINNLGGELWNYNYLEAPEAGKLDFLSMAQHEIGHTLGFISGAHHTEEDVDNSFGNRIYNMSTMDLFRYSEESIAQEMNDMTYGRTAFFSVDGQETLIELTTGVEHQIGHLAQVNEHALMSPTIRLAERWSITGDDLMVLDAIGWDVVNPGSIDMAAIYNSAEARLEFSQIGDRRIEVEESIFSGEAYHWGRASSTASGGGWWWGRASSTASGGGWWQKAYFMEVESTIDSVTGETQHYAIESNSSKFWGAVETISNWLKDNWGDNWWENSSGNNWWENSSGDNWWGSSSGNNWWENNNDDDDDDDDD